MIPIAITGIFQYDPDYLQNEQKYKDIKTHILGEESEGDDESGSEDSEMSDEDNEESRGCKSFDKMLDLLYPDLIEIRSFMSQRSRKYRFSTRLIRISLTSVARYT
jgi:hypothetical protein